MKIFHLGQLVTTPGVLEQVDPQSMALALSRHAAGDWGDLDDEDKRRNDTATDPKDPQRLLSSYRSASGVKFWIITEWDRSVTTFLLPSEY